MQLANPGSNLQEESHPSFGVKFVSSQVSFPQIVESPQTVKQVVGNVVEQFHPVSFKQVELHPSLLTRFPSSHSSI